MRALYRGNYVPGLSKALACVYGESNPHVIAIAAEVVVGFDTFARTIDDLTDVPQHDVGKLHDGALALIKSYELAGSVVSDMRRFTSLAMHYCKEASLAERYLQDRHRRTLEPFLEYDLDMLGKKNAVLKVALAFYDSRTGKPVYSIVERFIEKASVAVQIVDDMCDWREDLRAGNYTYPLVLASHLGANLADESDVASSFLKSGFAVQALLKAENYLQDCSRIIMGQHDLPSLHETLGEMRQSLHQARLCLQDLPADTDPDEALELFKDRLIPMLNYF